MILRAFAEPLELQIRAACPRSLLMRRQLDSR